MPTDRPKGFVELHYMERTVTVQVSAIARFGTAPVDARNDALQWTWYELVGDKDETYRHCDETPAELAALIAEAQAEDPAARIAEVLKMLCNYASLAVSESSSSSDGMHQTTSGLRMSTRY